MTPWDRFFMQWLDYVPIALVGCAVLLVLLLLAVRRLERPLWAIRTQLEHIEQKLAAKPVSATAHEEPKPTAEHHVAYSAFGR
jgi:cytochrome oxidase assembly protein ShyY1